MNSYRLKSERGVDERLLPGLAALAAVLLVAALCWLSSERAGYRDMRAKLDSLQTVNQADTVFRSDSLQRALTAYFSRHGSANDRLLAHYLLGRAHADMGESPAALHDFLEATESADTTRADCDFRLLAIVHGQMGLLYQQVGLSEYNINELTLAERYARICGDTLNALIFNDHRASEYYMLGRRDSSIVIDERAAIEYERLGRPDYAAIVRGQAAYYLIEEGKLERAYKYLEEYERHSGHVERGGNAKPGREMYYYWKGSYHLSSGHIDSATYYFRRLQREATKHVSRNAAAEGLYNVFLTTQQKDSIVKYARLTRELNDSAYSRETASLLQRLQANYNYDHHVRMAEASERKARRARHVLFLGLLSAAAILGMTAYMVVRYKRRLRKKSSELQAMRTAYVEELRSQARNRMELEKLRQRQKSLSEERERMEGWLPGQEDALGEKERVILNYTSLMAKKDAEISELQREIEAKNALLERSRGRVRDYESQNARTDSGLSDAAIIRRFLFIASHPREKAEEEDWLELERLMEATCPDVCRKLKMQYRLKPDEYHICQLVLLHLSPGEIASVMDLNHDNVSKKRRRMLAKLFQTDGKPADFDRKLQAMAGGYVLPES